MSLLIQFVGYASSAKHGGVPCKRDELDYSLVDVWQLKERKDKFRQVCIHEETPNVTKKIPPTFGAMTLIQNRISIYHLRGRSAMRLERQLLYRYFAIVYVAVIGLPLSCQLISILDSLFCF